MSIKTLRADTLAWFRCLFLGGSFQSFTLNMKCKSLENTTNAAGKPLLQINSPNSQRQFGVYFKGDGTTVRMSDADQTSNASADHPVQIVQNVPFELTLRGYRNGSNQARMRLTINGQHIDMDATAYDGVELAGWVHGNDYYVSMDLETDDVFCVNFSLTDDAVVAANANPAPWSLFTQQQLIGWGSCRGATYDQAVSTLQVGQGASTWGYGMSNHQCDLGGWDWVYGPTATVRDNTKLPIAYKSTWAPGGATSPTTTIITTIAAGDSREKIRVMPNAPFVPQTGGNTDGRYQVDRQGNTSQLPTDSGAGGAVHSPIGITHPDGGWAFQRTELNGKPRFYHRVGPGLTIFGNTFRSEYGSFGSSGEVALGQDLMWVMMTRFPASFFQANAPFFSFMDVHLQDANPNNHYTGPGPLGLWGDRTGISVYTRLGTGGNWQNQLFPFSFTPIVDKEYWWSFKFKMNFTGSAYLRVGMATDTGTVTEVVNTTALFGADAQPSDCFIKEGLYDFAYPWVTLGDNKCERYSAGHCLWDNSGDTISHTVGIDTLRYQTMVA